MLYLDLDPEYFGVGIEYRDRTNDQVAVDAAHANAQCGMGVIGSVLQAGPGALGTALIHPADG